MIDDATGLDSAEAKAPKERTPTEKWADAGQIMSVFCSDPRYRDLPGQVLYLKLMPALALGQYMILRKPMKVQGTENVLPGPIGAILWARISDQLHEQFLATSGGPKLDIADWNSGDNFWIIDSPGDPRKVGESLEILHREQFGGNPFNAFINKGREGVVVRTFGA